MNCRLLLLPFVAVLIGPTFAANVPTTDLQSWSEIDAIANLAPRTQAVALGTVRMGQDLPNPALSGGGLLLAFSLGPWKITGGDIFAGTKSPASEKNLKVQLPLAIVAYSHNFARFTLSDSNRIEQLEGTPGAPWRYRNKVTIDAPTRRIGPVSHLFVADEAFYSLASSQWNRNRASVGVGAPLSRSTELQLFYLRQDSRSGQPRTLNVAGTTLLVWLSP